jgi:hypothetical protein
MTSKLVISFDFELGWGVLDSPTWRLREQQGLYQRMRPVMAEVFDFLEKHEIPTTWATVSSMTIEKESELPLDHLPPAYRKAVVEFFNSAAPETRCGLDLLAAWQQQLAPFSELCSHTATHLYPSFGDVTAEHYVADVAASVDRLEALYGKPMDSLIFTRDQDAFREQVSAYRSMNLRIGPQNYGKAGSGKLRRMMGGVARFWDPIPESHVALGPQKECTHGGSLYFNWSGGDFEAIKRLQVRTQASRLLRQMRQQDSTFHLWLHPFNLAESTHHWRLFQRFLTEAVRLRDAGSLAILTMRDRGLHAL